MHIQLPTPQSFSFWTDLIIYNCLSLVTSSLLSSFFSSKEFDLGCFLWPGGEEEGLVILTGVAS